MPGVNNVAMSQKSTSSALDKAWEIINQIQAARDFYAITIVNDYELFSNLMLLIKTRLFNGPDYDHWIAYFRVQHLDQHVIRIERVENICADNAHVVIHITKLINFKTGAPEEEIALYRVFVHKR